MDIREYLLKQQTQTYNAWYRGQMSYSLYSESWQKYIQSMVEKANRTPENFFKVVIDLYAAAIQPVPEAFQQFTAVELLNRGESICLVDSQGGVHFPEHYEVVSDGGFAVAAVFMRSLADMQDYCVFAWSDGRQELWAKPVPQNLARADRKGYKKVEESRGELIRLALKDHGLGEMLAPLQDRINHSIVDQTLVGEMYARPFWYLLKYQQPVRNPYVDQPELPYAEDSSMKEARGQAARIFTTSGEGPFGQLQPPDLGKMMDAHRELIIRMSQTSGVPQFYLNLASGEIPTGVALKQLSSRFNKRVDTMRKAITPQLDIIAGHLGVTEDLYSASADIMQDILDQHGLALTQMGYPLDYIASVVTPDVDLRTYERPDE